MKLDQIKARNNPATAACIIAGIIRPYIIADNARGAQSVAMKLAWAVVKGELFEGVTTPLFKQFLPTVQEALGEWVKDRVVFVAASFREGEEIIEALTGHRYASLQSRKYIWQGTRDWLALARCKQDFWLYDGPLVTYKGDLIFPWEPRE